YVMYKWKTGEIFYDADGSGPGAQIKIAQIGERLSLGHDDFLIGDGDTAIADGVQPDDNMSGVVIPDDFRPGADKIVFNASVFTSLDAGRDGTLDASQFKIAARA